MKNQITPPEVLILGGIPASGKSTFRAEFLKKNPDYVAVSRDDFRYMLRNVGWEPAIEPQVTQLVNQTIINSLLLGRSVIIDATHCNEKAINGYSFIKDLFPVKISYKFIEVDLQVAIERDSKRERSVGAEVITKMWKDLQAFKAGARYKQITGAQATAGEGFPKVFQNPSLRQAVIFDIDGTLAHMKKRGGRGPFDWKRVGEDDLDVKVREVLYLHQRNKDAIIIMSGRDGSCRAETEAWLLKHNIMFDALFMRPEGSMEKDSIVKNRLFLENVLPNYFTKIVYDDRDQVVETWRQMGLTCFQVAPGSF